MLKNSRYILFTWISCCVLFCTTTFARSYDDIISSNKISIAVYENFPPFSYLENGKEKGIDVELAQHIAKQLGVKLDLRWTGADEDVEGDLRNNLWKGHKIDRTLADLMLRIPYDKDYTLLLDDVGLPVHEHVHMFAPYHTETWKIIFNSKKIESVSTMATFMYHNIGVEVDSIPQFYMMSAFKGRMREKTQHFPSISLAISAMQENSVDAVMGLRSQISHFQDKLNATDYKLATNAFPMMGQQQWDLGMAIKKDYRQLGYAVADIVESAVTTGLMKKLFSKYGAIYQAPSLYSLKEE